VQSLAILTAMNFNYIYLRPANNFNVLQWCKAELKGVIVYIVVCHYNVNFNHKGSFIKFIQPFISVIL